MDTEELVKRPGWAKRRQAISMDIEVATLRLCLQHGIEAVTVEDIAADVGLSRRTIYRYFDSIEDILRASPRRRLEQIAQGVQARPATETIRDAFVHVMKGKNLPDEAVEIQDLTSRLAKKFPMEWSRVIAPVALLTDALFENVTAERLKASGKDPKWARLVSGSIVFVIQRVNRDLGNVGLGSTEQLDEAFQLLAEELSSQEP